MNSPNSPFSSALIATIQHIFKSQREKELHIKASGESCLTCKHTKKSLGIKLLCTQKDKLVTQHNFCHLWSKMK